MQTEFGGEAMFLYCKTDLATALIPQDVGVTSCQSWKSVSLPCGAGPGVTTKKDQAERSPTEL